MGTFLFFHYFFRSCVRKAGENMRMEVNETTPSSLSISDAAAARSLTLALSLPLFLSLPLQSPVNSSHGDSGPAALPGTR